MTHPNFGSPGSFRLQITDVDGEMLVSSGWIDNQIPRTVFNQFAAGEWIVGEEEEINFLCGNPDCGQFIDLPQRGVPFLDRETKLVVMLCPSCARHAETKWTLRYQRVAEGEEE